MAQLNPCPHCGAQCSFMLPEGGAQNSVFAQCTGCKIQTQPVVSSLEYSAKDKVANTWNAALQNEWPAWVQPTGAHDAYSKSSKVSHASKRWVSNVNANVWQPGVSGWTLQGGAT